MFYLRKVAAVMEEPWDREEMGGLARSLSEEGIVFSCQGAAGLREDFAQETGEEPGVLWITDLPGLGRSLLEEGQAVLAFLRREKGNGDFVGVLFACEGWEGIDAQYLEKVYRRYQGIPWDILQTPRCLLRETVEDDVEAFYEMYRDPEITRYTEGLYPEREQERQYIRDYREKVYGFYHFGVWTVVSRETGEIIGRAGLSMREGFEDPELGFVIALPWQGKGIAYEICSAILDYARDELGFYQVQALVEPENGASLGLCGRLGMRTKERLELQGKRYVRMVKVL